MKPKKERITTKFQQISRKPNHLLKSTLDPLAESILGLTELLELLRLLAR